jgi:hypothetical protein
MGNTTTSDSRWLCHASALMKLVLIPLLVLLWSPAPSKETTSAVDDLECTAPQGLGDDAVTKCKRKCNSQCNGASNKSKCVAECRRACEK